MEWKPLWDDYHICSDGYIKVVRTTQSETVTERMLMPGSVNGTIIYNMRTGNGPARQYSINTILDEEYGYGPRLLPQRDIARMRDYANAFNAAHCPHANKKTSAAMSAGIKRSNASRGIGSGAAEYVMNDPWETYGIEKDSSGNKWADPIMDPMSHGFPMVTFCVPSCAGEVAA